MWFSTCEALEPVWHRSALPFAVCCRWLLSLAWVLLMQLSLCILSPSLKSWEVTTQQCGLHKGWLWISSSRVPHVIIEHKQANSLNVFHKTLFVKWGQHVPSSWWEFYQRCSWLRKYFLNIKNINMQKVLFHEWTQVYNCLNKTELLFTYRHMSEPVLLITHRLRCLSYGKL